MDTRMARRAPETFEGGATDHAVTPPSPTPHQSLYGFRSVHPCQLALFRSANDGVMFWSVPYVPPLKYAPVGHTYSDGRWYCLTSRRR